MAGLTGNSVNSTSYLSVGPTTSPTINTANAQKLGLGGVSLPGSLDAARQAAGVMPASTSLRTAAPVSPVTQKPVSSFGSGISSAATPQSASAGSYKGFAITPGSDADVAAQIARIDAGRPTQTSEGSIVSSGIDGSISSPSKFNINTSGPISSNILGSNLSQSDVANTRKSYQDYVMGLSEASQYSQEYLNSYEKLKNIQASAAKLKGNLATGDVRGDTQGYAEGFTNRQLMGAGAQEAFANIGLATQELMRQGNIAGAKALVDAFAPQSVSPGSSLISPVDGQAVYGGTNALSDYQAQQSYFDLARQYPDAQIPAYNSNISPQANYQIAQSLASGSPSFQTSNQITFQSPAGGLYTYNKKTGEVGTLISDEQGLAGGSAASAIKQLNEQKVQVSRSISALDSNFPLLLNAAKQAGIGETTPLFVNGVQQKAALQLGSSGSAALQALNTSLQTAVQAVIASRGGSLTNEVRAEANSILNGTYNLSQLRAVYSAVKAEGANTVSSYDQAIRQQLNQATSGSFSGGSGGLYDF